MNIIVLDGYTLNPSDLSWDELKSLGHCEIFERTTPDQVTARAVNAEIVLTNKVVLDRGVLGALPQLRYVGVLATGYNVVDIAAASEHGIVVTNVPDYSTRSVAQLTIALLLELTHHAGHHARSVRDGRWCKSPDFCYWEFPLLELDGLTFGIIGFGRIGRAVAAIAQTLGMRVLVHSRGRPAQLAAGIEIVPLEALLRQSDVVSLHCPLTPETQSLIDAERLALMKPTAFLINTSRGPLLDEAALAEALNKERLAGAALDVLTKEPPEAANPLLRAKNCHITPHIGWATLAARKRLMNIAVNNVRAFLAGKPVNTVN